MLKPNFNKTQIIWIIVCFILAVILLSAGYALFNHYKLKQIDSTANQTTYSNNQYGFSFKYPKDWPINDQIQKSGEATIGQSLTIGSLSVWVNPSGFGFESARYFYEAEIKNNKIVVNKKIQQQGDDLINQVTIGPLSSESNNYFLVYEYEKAKDLDILDQILNSFQFTTDWKTYTSSADNYSLKYPPDWTNKIENGEVAFNNEADISKLNQGARDGGWEVWVSVKDKAALLQQLECNSNATIQVCLDSRLKEKDPTIVSYKKIRINNLDAFEVIGGGFALDNKTIYLEQNNKVYELQDIITAQNPIFDQMVQTFTINK